MVINLVRPVYGGMRLHPLYIVIVSLFVPDSIAYTVLDLLTNELGVLQIDVPMRNAFDWATHLHQKAVIETLT